MTRIFLHDYDAALAWERRWPHLTFVRRPLLHGYEVEVLGVRPELVPSDWMQIYDQRYSLEPDGGWREAIYGSGDRVEQILFEGKGPDLSDKKSVRLDLSYSVCSAISFLISDLVNRLDVGRATRFPLRVTAEELVGHLRESPYGRDEVTFSLDLGQGAVLIVAKDHTALIGRHSGRDVLLEPWIFHIVHASGKDWTNDPNGCFLCRLRGIRYGGEEPGEYFFNGHFASGEPTKISIKGASDASPADLAPQILAWCEALGPYSARLSPACPPPVFTNILLPDWDKAKLHLEQQATLLSCLLAARTDFEYEYSVNVTWDSSGFQRPAAPYFCYVTANKPGSSRAGKTDGLHAMPDLGSFDPSFPAGAWAAGARTVSSFPEPSGSPSSYNPAVRVTFPIERLSEHDRLQLLSFLDTIQKRPDLHKQVRQWLEKPPTYRGLPFR